jgi:hypothetical protein
MGKSSVRFIFRKEELAILIIILHILLIKLVLFNIINRGILLVIKKIWIIMNIIKKLNLYSLYINSDIKKNFKLYKNIYILQIKIFI